SNESKLDSNLTQEQWEQCLESFNNSCAYCGTNDEVMCREHFIPVIKGGEFSKNNIIPCCVSCNSSKRDRDFFEWYPTKDFYSKQRENKILKYLNYKYHTQQLSIL